jgi:hypothetical protein
LDLTGTLITDASIESIHDNATLEELTLQDVAVSERAVRLLKNDNQSLKVVWSEAPSRRHLLAMRKLSQLGAAIYFVSKDEATTDIEWYFPPGYRVAIIGNDRIWNHWKDSDSGLAALADIEGISALMLTGLPYSEETAQLLSKLPELQSIELSNVHVLSLLGWFLSIPQKKLLHLSLRGTRLYGRHEMYLSQLPQLESLSLADTGIGDRSLARLQNQRNLLQIDLSSTLVTDIGMATLARLDSLERVFLSRIGISDAGLVELRRLMSLREIGLCMTNVSDSGLATLSTMKAIEELDLSFTGITDAGLAELRGLPRLGKINLCGAFISDNGLQYLAEISTLKDLWLMVDGNRVTKAGVQRLQAEVPSLEITVIGGM